MITTTVTCDYCNATVETNQAHQVYERDDTSTFFSVCDLCDACYKLFRDFVSKCNNRQERS